jgi:hypothetical protein
MNGAAKRVSQLSLCLALLLALGACQKVGETAADVAIERATGTSVERDGDQVTLRSADGQVAIQTGDSVPLPEDFPADVYLPEGYQVNSVMDLQGVSMVSLTAPGQVSGLFAAARESMQSQGWTQSMSAQHSADTAMIAFEKGADQARRSATLSFNRNNGDDHVIVAVQLQGEHQ